MATLASFPVSFCLPLHPQGAGIGVKPGSLPSLLPQDMTWIQIPVYSNIYRTRSCDTFSEVLTMNITFSLEKKKINNLLQILILPHTKKNRVQRRYCLFEAKCEVLFWCSQVQGHAAITVNKLYSPWDNATQKCCWTNCSGASNVPRTPKDLNIYADDLVSIRISEDLLSENW